jgi:hypothetical protein
VAVPVCGYRGGTSTNRAAGLETSTKAIMPTGDFEKDMHEIKLYFKDFRGKIPENFSVGIN